MAQTSNYAIRDKRTGDLVKRFDNPIEAELELREKGMDPNEYEIAERTSENIYTKAPDGKVYIVGIKHKWIRDEA